MKGLRKRQVLAIGDTNGFEPLSKIATSKETSNKMPIVSQAVGHSQRTDLSPSMPQSLVHGPVKTRHGFSGTTS